MKFFHVLILIAAFGLFACSESQELADEMDGMPDDAEMMADNPGDMPDNVEEMKYNLGDGAYGHKKINADNAEPAEVIYEKINNSDTEIAVKGKGEITQVCKASGCWVNVKAGDKEYTILFKDSFSIPKEGMVGKHIVFEGVGDKDKEGEVQVIADAVLIL